MAGERPLAPFALPLAAAVVVASASACGPSPGGEGRPSSDTVDRRDTVARDAGGQRSIHAVLADHREAWMSRPEVTGTGIGLCEGEPCIVVYLLHRTEEAEAAFPDSVDGHPVRLEVTGRFETGGRPGGDTAGG